VQLDDALGKGQESDFAPIGVACILDRDAYRVLLCKEGQAMAAGGKSTNEHALERLVFFSDAVFAIAITLLVIELHAPELPRGSADGAHWAALGHLIPSFFGFGLSFVVIGRFWIGHHRAFSLTQSYNDHLLGPNLALLGVIAFLPFATAYLSANLGQRVPTLLYYSCFFVAGLLNLRVQKIATSPPLVKSGEKTVEIAALRARNLSVVGAAFCTIALSFFTPAFGPIMLGTMPLFERYFARKTKQTKP
jgi:uncharacterized membrane protein